MTPRAPRTFPNRDHRGRRQPLRRRLFTALGALLALAPPLMAGNPQGIELEHLTTEDGLSHSTVWDVLQDRQGFLWFATGGLLQCYDGYEFTSFQHDPDDPESVSAGKPWVRASFRNTRWSISRPATIWPMSSSVMGRRRRT